MHRALGHETGQAPGSVGFSWGDYLDWLVETHGSLAAEARAELVLVSAFVANREDPSRVDALLAQAEPILQEAMAPHDRACLHARWIDQRAYSLNRKSADLAAAEALCRRANGLAYATWKQGRRDEAVHFAREACEMAGDGGPLRLRAMALTMLGRILGGADGEDARARAVAIVTSLDDEALRLRFRAPTLAPTTPSRRELAE